METRFTLIQDSQKRYEAIVKELEALLSCYQKATQEDRRIVWAVLGKYEEQP